MSCLSGHFAPSLFKSESSLASSLYPSHRHSAFQRSLPPTSRPHAPVRLCGAAFAVPGRHLRFVPCIPALFTASQCPATYVAISCPTWTIKTCTSTSAASASHWHICHGRLSHWIAYHYADSDASKRTTQNLPDTLRILSVDEILAIHIARDDSDMHIHTGDVPSSTIRICLCLVTLQPRVSTRSQHTTRA